MCVRDSLTIHGPASEVSAASSIVHPVPRIDIHLQHLHHPLVLSCSIDELIQGELPYVIRDNYFSEFSSSIIILEVD